MTFGGEAFPFSGGSDASIAKLDHELNHVWSLAVGSAGNEDVKGIAIDADGIITASGQFHGSIDFGNGPLVATGNEADMYVVRAGP